MSAPQLVRVALGDRAYDVAIGSGLLDSAAEFIAPLSRTRRLFIVTDENVARLHLPRLERALAAMDARVSSTILPPGEAQKSFSGLERVSSALLDAGADRGDLVVAFGGGVIGDLAGLTAGLLKRGMDFVQIPTTLLAQVDSSVGGKTAIDTPQGKNLVGLFYQPRLVLADLDVLGTLPEREMRAGYAEIVKYGLIDLPEFYAWLDQHGPRVLAGDADALAHAVRVSVEAKARIVALDEREGGARALLNLGHTFAHALETAAGYDGALLHGEAVGVGMAMAFEFSARQGLCPWEEAAQVRAHLARLGFALDLWALPGSPHDADQLLRYMSSDKKAEGGSLTFILTRGVGRAFVQKNVDPEAVRAFLSDVA